MNKNLQRKLDFFNKVKNSKQVDLNFAMKFLGLENEIRKQKIKDILDV